MLDTVAVTGGRVFETNLLATYNTLVAAGNCWSYVDVRDVAGLVAAALAADVEGHEAFHAAAAENYLDVPTADAVEAFFGSLPDECSLTGDESVLSTAKTERLLGWTPAYAWREAASATAEEPSLHAE